jgi:hypothetical protein
MIETAPETAVRQAPHPSVRMRRATRQKAARRERHRLAAHAERMALLHGAGRSDRSRFKERERETAEFQVTLDKERGLEWGRIARDAYRATRRPPDPPEAKHRCEPRSADTYRWARKKLARGPRRALALKAERHRTGETRAEADRRRRRSESGSE